MKHVDFLEVCQGDKVMVNGVHYFVRKIEGDSILIENSREKMWVKYYELD